MNRKIKPLTSSILYCAVVCSASPPGMASEQFEQGLSAYEKGRYSLAFRLIKKSAEQGKASAQHLLGAMYRRGLGIEPDEYEGFYWCKRAAEEGLLEAQFQLGLMYLHGEGVTEDQGKAMEWLWAAADRGYPQASEVLQYILSGDNSEEFGIGC
jgi:TPR repeat protein